MKRYLPEGERILSLENQSYFSSVKGLYEAYQSAAILEARAIMCDCQHNLIVDMGYMKGVIPREEGAEGIAEGTTRDIALISKVNKAVCFKIISMQKDENGETYALLSRKAVQQECRKNYLFSLEPGDVIPAKVTHLENFGCFVDIGCGISSLIPIDAISVSRISHPADRFKVGQNIYAVVKSMDEQGRLLLSHKELLGTWEENARNLESGDTVSGIIRSVEEYGIFVELAPNLAGLAELKENVHPGQHASVYIKSLIPEKMKIKLIIVDAFDPERDRETGLQPLKYFITGRHINHWIYSPENCEKNIETVFSQKVLTN